MARGETVVVTRAVDGWPWPEAVARRGVQAPPAAVMAVYADFAGHAAWMPDVVASRVVGRPSADTVRVAYEYDTPGPNERYTVDVRLIRDGAAWEATWTLVEARYARRLAGALRAEPCDGGTRLTYTSRVDPGPLGTTFGSAATTAWRLGKALDALASAVERRGRT